MTEVAEGLWFYPLDRGLVRSTESSRSSGECRHSPEQPNTTVFWPSNYWCGKSDSTKYWEKTRALILPVFVLSEVIKPFSKSAFTV